MAGSGQSVRWVIENCQTGAWLGTYTRHAADSEAEFGMRVPFLFGDLRAAKHAWLKHGIYKGYYKPGVSLNSRLDNVQRGANYPAMPPVQYRQVMFSSTVFVVEEPGHA